jgi:hypothetical protein
MSAITAKPAARTPRWSYEDPSPLGHVGGYEPELEAMTRPAEGKHMADEE